MASQFYLKEIKRENRLTEILDEEDPKNEGIEICEDDRIKILEKAWQSLPVDEKTILKAYYYDDQPLNKIADLLNINEVTMRKKKQRAMDKLRNLYFNIKN
jgi:RNA polymerase sigma factor (sigma-70 family)